ncbi:phenylalanine--tRNA ligase subunit beta [Methanocella arvoryzae]|uniref:Phenylalanine--tRNA ligase beta subunit n=1 Tax=Methanocella arvoryzae (strain DSM 22066 / NBRC 105507 / MRE50) TaxID=351160 RepID=SYFB_METAR|nr:phenylalanine--tRNA ligase subunit beta [Methanocella arvoryzae]Q0W0X4.1 RecName: Full=Phenylalanine--tRNA ligase beta subunit; AltName: Full=Phenylalanyl-tRNA synthetase beta subunit; Short=PheRS [Methanocella arvoryzae MRE50]CAJ37969.1 phenylalanyl-tRNA synthetase, beta chain [Methanocella arvoryzae MRE50]
MATVTLNYPDLVKLIGIDLSLDKVREVMFELGSETEDIQGDEVTFEVTSDRADLLSEEGIARMLRAYYSIETGFRIPKLQPSGYKLIVNREVEPVRPYVTGAIVRNVQFTDESIKSLMHLQEKLHGTFGRKRKKGAVGVHDLSKIKGREIHYRAVPGDSVKFVPLQSDELMTLSDVLARHPKGIDYRYVLEGKNLMPIITDDEGIFSFPPIINSKRTEVTLNTHDLLIELTGEDLRTIDYMLNIVLYSLDLRGASIYSIDVVYPDETLHRPDFNVRNIDIEVDYVNRVLGLELTAPDIKALLERMGFKVAETGSDYLIVEVPPYRADILHKRDVVDDVGRAFGYNNITPSYPNTPSVGKLTEATKLGDAIRNTMIGLGCQDTFNFILIGKDEVFGKMNLPDDGTAVEISNPYAEQYNIVRTSLIPSLMIVLSNNLHRDYPQNIFEVGTVAHLDSAENTGVKEIDHVACTLCYAKAGFNEIKVKLQSLCANFGKLDELKTVAAEHPSFIPGRCAEVRIGDKKVGIIGELSPVVLKSWGIEMPVAAFEMEIAALK